MRSIHLHRFTMASKTTERPFNDEEHLLTEEEKVNFDPSQRPESRQPSRSRNISFYSIVLNIILSMVAGLAWMYALKVTHRTKARCPDESFCKCLNHHSLFSPRMELNLMMTCNSSRVRCGGVPRCRFRRRNRNLQIAIPRVIRGSQRKVGRIIQW